MKKEDTPRSGLIAEFTAHVVPRGSTRPRFSRATGTARKNPTAVQVQASIAAAAAPAFAGLPMLDEPLRVVVRAYAPRPKKLMRKKDPPGWLPWISRPDADNVLKHVLDGLAAYWRDDCLVCEVTISKRYPAKTGRPRIEVEVHRVDANPSQTTTPTRQWPGFEG